MYVEFWDRVGMFEQQNMIGRDRASGTPLGGSEEFEDPRYDLDPDGMRIPLNAHIRLANPRTAQTADQRILRRGYNYDRGLDEAGNLDQGLVFVAFNQDIRRQFATIQARLAEETDERLHHAGRRRLFLRAAGGARAGGLGRVRAVHMSVGGGAWDGPNRTVCLSRSPAPERHTVLRCNPSNEDRPSEPARVAQAVRPPAD